VLKHWRRSGAGAGSPVSGRCRHQWWRSFCAVREEQGKGCSGSAIVREFITVQLEDTILHIL
jgi:hypothetical protein